MNAEAFFRLHRDLPRQGPGETADVNWVGQQVQLPKDARIADLGCGPGADIGSLLGLAENATVTAVDLHLHFIEQARIQWGGDARVELLCGDMVDPHGPFDLIWCAGAAYILGVTEALVAWRGTLAPGGVSAFSEVCFWDAEPSADAAAVWDDYPQMSDAAGIDQRVRAAGYETIATRRLSAQAWENYYQPLELRIAGLRDDADADLSKVLEAASAEIAAYRRFGDEYGYLLSIVRPV